MPLGRRLDDVASGIPVGRVGCVVYVSASRSHDDLRKMLTSSAAVSACSAMVRVKACGPMSTMTKANDRLMSNGNLRSFIIYIIRKQVLVPVEPIRKSYSHRVRAGSTRPDSRDPL